MKKYKEHLNEFLLSTAVKEFVATLKTEVFDYTDIESITLRLDENRAEDTLKALNMFVYHIFGHSSKSMKIKGEK